MLRCIKIQIQMPNPARWHPPSELSQTDLITMLEHIDSQDFLDISTVLASADPEAAMLARALADCRHPKAGRLLVRLSQHPDTDARAELRADILQLLTLAFGKAEALRRLQ